MTIEQRDQRRRHVLENLSTMPIEILRDVREEMIASMRDIEAQLATHGHNADGTFAMKEADFHTWRISALRAKNALSRDQAVIRVELARRADEERSEKRGSQSDFLLDLMTVPGMPVEALQRIRDRLKTFENKS